MAGGTTSMAGGHFYLGGGTVVQRATGHDDSPDQMYAYLMAVTPDPEPGKIRAYADGSAAHCDWLEGLGFQFERSYYPEKAVIQPGTQGLMYTGNERSGRFASSPSRPPEVTKSPFLAILAVLASSSSCWRAALPSSASALGTRPGSPG